ncbi:hypothetical protein NGF19_26120 [Streptomyces sp. RY43-2]|uniref:Integron gene cassette protein n=1 Tax=Streptomyces macrolidinus TaxID=2952607 RepID=A0ABT0ZL09_9ACTN|nr:hypothetical protein [Streptomyces macrolidinus]MCN9244217.1 hypothetical protein [Streptomyces macrolidinus]
MFRCTAEVELDDDVRVRAALIPSPHMDIDWAPFDSFQCVVEGAPHDHHAAFLRSGANTDPCTDVFLCWRDGEVAQWIEDVEVCLKRSNPMGSGCTIFKGHPGRCDWQYIDPLDVAARAQADQLIKEWRLSHRFRTHD